MLTPANRNFEQNKTPLFAGEGLIENNVKTGIQESDFIMPRDFFLVKDVARHGFCNIFC